MANTRPAMRRSKRSANYPPATRKPSALLRAALPSCAVKFSQPRPPLCSGCYACRSEGVLGMNSGTCAGVLLRCLQFLGGALLVAACGQAPVKPAATHLKAEEA